MIRMQFYRKGDEVFVSHFDPTIYITGCLLRLPYLDTKTLERKFRTITFHCANGTQEYRMVSYDRSQDVFHCRAIIQ